jgi:hypothetical protein
LKKGLFGIIFSDVLISFIGLVFVLFLLVSLVPKGEMEKKSVDLGSVCAEIVWPSDRDVDLDLWGKSPLENVAIGYSNPHGLNLSLFRDVLGWVNNPSHINLEIMCGNQLVAGEYIFNVSYFSNHNTSQPDPIEVTMTITIKNKISKEYYTGKYILTHAGEEKTMFAFRLDDNGILVPGSVNSLNHPLRDAKDSQYSRGNGL